jgi:hypothetical protein
LALPEQIVVLADIPDLDADTFELLYFERDEGPHIPVFSRADAFQEQTAGTEYMHKGVAIDTRLLGAVLEADYPIILDPLTPRARIVEKSELLGITR